MLKKLLAISSFPESEVRFHLLRRFICGGHGSGCRRAATHVNVDENGRYRNDAVGYCELCAQRRLDEDWNEMVGCTVRTPEGSTGVIRRVSVGVAAVAWDHCGGRVVDQSRGFIENECTLVTAAAAPAAARPEAPVVADAWRAEALIPPVGADAVAWVRAVTSMFDGCPRFVVESGPQRVAWLREAFEKPDSVPGDEIEDAIRITDAFGDAIRIADALLVYRETVSGKDDLTRHPAARRVTPWEIYDE